MGLGLAIVKNLVELHGGDDEPARFLLWRMLEECNAQVEVVDSAAAAALERIRHSLPDLLVSDIGIPKEDGYDLIRQVRSLPPDRGGALPAIAPSTPSSPSSATTGKYMRVAKSGLDKPDTGTKPRVWQAAHQLG